MAGHHPDHGQWNRRHDYQRYQIAAELCHHQQVDQHYADRVSDAHVAEGLVGDLPFAVPLDCEGAGVGGQKIAQTFIAQPQDTSDFAIKWDGEWQITYETFRDMGIAYAAGLVLIYLLIVAQFRSYVVPLIIMAPIPMTVIGVMPGHALLGAQFTATSMIGMIALAGIIVRNSILLVDFINLQVREGTPLKDAIVHSAITRAQPIVLTGLAAMIGAFFILDDPIFNGLAISLIFGIFVSTVLTLVVIPTLYYAAYRKQGRNPRDGQDPAPISSVPPAGSNPTEAAPH